MRYWTKIFYYKRRVIIKPNRTGNEVSVIARAAVGGLHYEPSVCAPYTTDLRADFDFTTRLPEGKKSALYRSRAQGLQGRLASAAALS